MGLTTSALGSSTALGVSVTYTAQQFGGITGAADSTGILITFNDNVTNFSTSGITITGATKGSLTNNNDNDAKTWLLGISNITVDNGGYVTIDIADWTGFDVTTSQRSVQVFKGSTVLTHNLNTGSLTVSSGETRDIYVTGIYNGNSDGIYISGGYSGTITLDNVSIESTGSYNGIQKSALGALSGFGYRHNTVADKVVQVQVSISNPTAIKSDILVSGYVNGNEVTRIKTFLEKWFSNKLAIVHFDQTGNWGQTVQIAAKVDLSGMDTKNLMFYSYDKQLNQYKRIIAPKYWIDTNGYLHFDTELAGDIIISEGALALK